MKMTMANWICYLNKRVSDLENKTPSGSEFLFGDGTPPPSLGNNGDTYMRLNGGFLYKKENNFWVRKGKIQMESIDGGEVL